MIKSMTGFGKAIYEDEKCSIKVEIKSLNSKFLELNLRLPKQFSEKENEARNLLSDQLTRGKVNVFIDYEKRGGLTPKSQINKDLLGFYYNELKEAAVSVNELNVNLFNLALNMPDVVAKNELNDEEEEDWKTLVSVMEEAIEKVIGFRSDEGKKLSVALEGYIQSIGNLLKQVEEEEPPRKEAVRSKINAQLDEIENDYDQNRFEQELIYYLEKLDITEEKVRLKSHLEYFNQELNGSGSGKKLGFIAQEIGREINTIGSKANYAPMQHLVVQMKDDLEKIKEQVLNLV